MCFCCSNYVNTKCVLNLKCVHNKIFGERALNSSHDVHNSQMRLERHLHLWLFRSMLNILDGVRIVFINTLPKAAIARLLTRGASQPPGHGRTAVDIYAFLNFLLLSFPPVLQFCFSLEFKFSEKYRLLKMLAL